MIMTVEYYEDRGSTVTLCGLAVLRGDNLNNMGRHVAAIPAALMPTAGSYMQVRVNDSNGEEHTLRIDCWLAAAHVPERYVAEKLAQEKKPDPPQNEWRQFLLSMADGDKKSAADRVSKSWPLCDAPGVLATVVPLPRGRDARPWFGSDEIGFAVHVPRSTRLRLSLQDDSTTKYLAAFGTAIVIFDTELLHDSRDPEISTKIDGKWYRLNTEARAITGRGDVIPAPAADVAAEAAADMGRRLLQKAWDDDKTARDRAMEGGWATAGGWPEKK